MKIRKAEDRPMELHIKKGPKLRMKKVNKRITGRTSVRRIRKSPISGIYQAVKESGASIRVKRQSLYTMGRIGVSKAADQIEGGEEIKESAGLAVLALSSAYNGASKTKRLYQTKKLSGQAKSTDKNKSDKSSTGDGKTGKGKDRDKNLRRRDRDKDSRSFAELERRKKSVKARETNLKKPKGSDAYKSGRKNGFVKARMLEAFLAGKRREDENDQTVVQSIKETVREGALMLAKKIAVSVFPAFLGIFSVIALIGVIVVSVLGVIYNSPLSVFFPLPDTGYENPRMVLSSYYMEFNQKVMAIEENGDGITYQNTESGAPVSNFNDTLMVYMILYGDGRAGFVMDDEGKKNLKKVFDEMNYIDSESPAVEKEVGDSIGKVWVTAYCPCSSCCGSYANGITASGKTAKAKHTIAVDAYNPIVSMGRKS